MALLGPLMLLYRLPLGCCSDDGDDGVDVVPRPQPAYFFVCHAPVRRSVDGRVPLSAPGESEAGAKRRMAIQNRQTEGRHRHAARRPADDED